MTTHIQRAVLVAAAITMAVGGIGTAEAPPAVEAASTPAITPEPTASPTPTPTITPTPVMLSTLVEERRPSRYASITLSDDDIEILAQLVWLEARGEDYVGQVAVIEVVFNRVLSPNYPDTIRGVVFQKGQFSPAHRIGSVTASQTQYDAVMEAYEAIEPITDLDVVYFAMRPQNSNLFAKIGCHYFCREGKHE